MESVDSEKIQTAVNRFAKRPTDKLVGEVQRFRDERYLFDYETDEGCLFRINKVMKRVRLEQAEEDLLPWLAQARTAVYDNADELLISYPFPAASSGAD